MNETVSPVTVCSILTVPAESQCLQRSGTRRRMPATTTSQRIPTTPLEQSLRTERSCCSGVCSASRRDLSELITDLDNSIVDAPTQGAHDALTRHEQARARNYGA